MKSNFEKPITRESVTEKRDANRGKKKLEKDKILTPQEKRFLRQEVNQDSKDIGEAPLSEKQPSVSFKTVDDQGDFPTHGKRFQIPLEEIPSDDNEWEHFGEPEVNEKYAAINEDDESDDISEIDRILAEKEQDGEVTKFKDLEPNHWDDVHDALAYPTEKDLHGKFVSGKTSYEGKTWNKFEKWLGVNNPEMHAHIQLGKLGKDYDRKKYLETEKVSSRDKVLHWFKKFLSAKKNQN